MHGAVVISEWVGGALPILGIAWVLRRLVGRPASGVLSAVVSTLLAGVAGYVLRSFGEGEGGFQGRMANILTGSESMSIAGATGVALIVTLSWWLVKHGQRR